VLLKRSLADNDVEVFNGRLTAKELELYIGKTVGLHSGDDVFEPVPNPLLFEHPVVTVKPQRLVI
jgi:hypothetical protein